MVEALEQFFKHLHIVLAHKKILLACSGGPDSMALAHLLKNLQVKYNFQLGIAHVEHGIRGDISKGEAQFVKEYCKTYHLPFYYEEVNIPQLAQEAKKSQELQAREIRYKFFAQIMDEKQYDYLATGHHLNDQGETILMHLVRGSGLTGLGGIAPISNRKVEDKNITIIRPLLKISKNDILAYCKECNITYCVDQSNFSTDYTRNKFRWEILPKLEEINPQVLKALGKIGEIARTQEDFLANLIEKKAKELLVVDNCKVTVKIALLLKEHEFLQNQLIRHLYALLTGNTADLSAVHIDNIRDILYNGTVGKKLPLPRGIMMERSYDSLVFSKDKAKESTEKLPSININIRTLQANRAYNYKFGSYLITIKIENEIDVQPKLSRDTIYLPLDEIKGQLVIRSRQQGDYMELPNLGRRKLKNILIDAKVPALDRDSIPVIADELGIIWLAGIRYSNRCTPKGKQLLYIKIN